MPTTCQALGPFSLSASIKSSYHTARWHLLRCSLDLMFLVSWERAGTLLSVSLCDPGEPTTSTPGNWRWMNESVREWVYIEMAFGIMRLSTHNSLCCSEIENSVLSYSGVFILNTKCVLDVFQKKALERGGFINNKSYHSLGARCVLGIAFTRYVCPLIGYTR